MCVHGTRPRWAAFFNQEYDTFSTFAASSVVRLGEGERAPSLGVRDSHPRGASPAYGQEQDRGHRLGLAALAYPEPGEYGEDTSVFLSGLVEAELGHDIGDVGLDGAVGEP